MEPNINAKLSQSMFIFIACIAMSYLSHVGWWAMTGIALTCGLLTESTWSKFWIVIAIILFGLSIWRMGWVYF